MSPASPADARRWRLSLQRREGGDEVAGEPLEARTVSDGSAVERLSYSSCTAAALGLSLAQLAASRGPARGREWPEKNGQQINTRTRSHDARPRDNE